MLLIACACGQKMKVPPDAIGKVAKCVKCGETIKISAVSATPMGKEAAPKDAAGTGTSQTGSPPAADAPREVGPVMQVLKEAGLLREEALAEVSLVQRDLPRSVWELLLQLGHLSGEDFHALMSKAAGAATIDLKNYNIPKEVVDFVPEDIVKERVLFPVDKLGKLLTIAMPCPVDVESVSMVEDATGLKVKTMVCTVDEIQKLIQSYYPAQGGRGLYDDSFSKELAKDFGELVEGNAVAARILETNSLAPSSETAAQLESACSNGAGTLEESTRSMLADPVSAALLLNVANSAAYGLPKRVDNVPLAVALLGVETMAKVIKDFGPRDYAEGGGAFDYATAWKRARFCCSAAHAIAMTLDSQRAQAAQTAGLLHEIGRFALLSAAPSSYAQVTKGLRGEELVNKEERVYGMSHMEAGYMLARRWNLPPGITEPLRWHRDPDGASKSKEVVSIVALACRMTDALEAGTDPVLEKDDSAMQALHLTEVKAANIYKEAVAAFKGG